MKLLRLIILCAGLAITLPVAAQEQSTLQNESEFYYVNVPIEKIFSYRQGYVILYRKGVNQTARTYLPLEWFHGTAAKGEIVKLGSGLTWPNLTVYYKDGKFSHVRLYVRRELTHESWGVITQTTNIDEYFTNVEDVKLEF